MLDFGVLGPVELVINGRPALIGPPKRRAVLAALLLDAGEPVLAETLIDRIWGEELPREVRNGLYSHIARLRRLLIDASAQAGAPVRLVRRSGGYALDADRGSIDLFRFRHLVERARGAEESAADVAGRLGRALALWRGEPLAGVAGAWADRVRGALTHQRLAVAVRWANLKLELRDCDAVIGGVGELAARYPLAEPLVAAQLRALFQAGRAAEALSCYAITRRRLAEELGVEPGPELRTVHQVILRGGRDRLPERSPVGSARPPARTATAAGAWRRMPDRRPDNQLRPDPRGHDRSRSAAEAPADRAAPTGW